jgi:hypothetical protein
MKNPFKKRDLRPPAQVRKTCEHCHAAFSAPTESALEDLYNAHDCQDALRTKQAEILSTAELANQIRRSREPQEYRTIQVAGPLDNYDRDRLIGPSETRAAIPEPQPRERRRRRRLPPPTEKP